MVAYDERFIAASKRRKLARSSPGSVAIRSPHLLPSLPDVRLPPRRIHTSAKRELVAHQLHNLGPVRNITHHHQPTLLHEPILVRCDLVDAAGGFLGAEDEEVAGGDAGELGEAAGEGEELGGDVGADEAGYLSNGLVEREGEKVGLWRGLKREVARTPFKSVPLMTNDERRARQLAKVRPWRMRSARTSCLRASRVGMRCL